jgi:hypothetical protein
LSVPHARGFLLLRRAGGVWGIANSAVDGLARRGEGYRVATSGGALAADEILGVVENLLVRPAAAVLGRFWPEATAGVAVHGKLPVVMVDPRRPPAALRAEEASAVAAGAEAEGAQGDGWDGE